MEVRGNQKSAVFCRSHAQKLFLSPPPPMCIGTRQSSAVCVSSGVSRSFDLHFPLPTFFSFSFCASPTLSRRALFKKGAARPIQMMRNQTLETELNGTQQQGDPDFFFWLVDDRRRIKLASKNYFFEYGAGFVLSFFLRRFQGQSSLCDGSSSSAINVVIH